MRLLIIAGSGLTTAALLTACGPAVHLAAPGTATTGQAPGIRAKSLSCDRFPAAEIQAAVRQTAATAVVRADGPASDSGRPDSLICGYTLYTPGTDLDSADRGLAQLTLAISDQWAEEPHVGDGKDDQRERAAFDANKASALKADGQTENDATFAVHEVPGIGAGAYLEDTTHKADGSTVSQYNDDLSVLHLPGPNKVDVTVGYALPQADQPLPDKALDTAMRDAAARARLIQSITSVQLAELGGA